MPRRAARGGPALIPTPNPPGWRGRLPGAAEVVSSLPADGVVGLTFDDGPDPVGTNTILDALDGVQAVATFFVLSDLVAQHPAVAGEIVRRGHEVALHGDRHERLDRLSVRAVKGRLDDARHRIEDVVAAPIRFHRPPYGRLSWRTMLACGDLGLRVAMWSHDPGDWRDLGEGDLAPLVAGCLVPGAIVLLHDGDAAKAATTASALAASGPVTHRGVRPVRLSDHQ